MRLEDYEKLGGLDGQVSYYLDQNLIIFARNQGIEPYEAVNECARWKSVFSSLVRTQPDGTVTTDLVSSADLQSSADALGCKIAFEVIAKYLCRPEIRILREASLTEGKKYYSLGHDTMGLAMDRARTFIAQRVQLARQARLRATRMGSVLAVFVLVVGGAIVFIGPSELSSLGKFYIAFSIVMLPITFWRSRRGSNRGLVIVPDPKRASIMRDFLKMSRRIPFFQSYVSLMRTFFLAPLPARRDA